MRMAGTLRQIERAISEGRAQDGTEQPVEADRLLRGAEDGDPRAHRPRLACARLRQRVPDAGPALGAEHAEVLPEDGLAVHEERRDADRPPVAPREAQLQRRVGAEPEARDDRGAALAFVRRRVERALAG